MFLLDLICDMKWWEIVLCGIAYLLCGIYIAGRYGYSGDSDHPGILVVPVLWPFVLAGRGIRLVWQRGNQHRFKD